MLFFNAQLFAQDQKLNYLQGKVVEKSTGQAIPYASVRINNSSQNTISNIEGVFVLSNNSKTTDSIAVSAVGFSTVKTALSDLNSKPQIVIVLEENITLLNTVTVTPLKAEEILKNAIRNSSKNYSAPSTLKGYYKEFVKRDSLLTKYADGIVSYLIKRQKNGTPEVSLAVSQSRVKEIEIPEEEDKINQLNTPIKIKGIGEFSDPAKTSLLDSANFKYYKYQLLEIEEKEKQIYVINFSPIIGSKKSLYTGKIYIDKESSLILGLDYTVAPSSRSFLTDINILGIHIGVISRMLSLRYKLENDHYHLSYVGQQFGMRIRSKRINQQTIFKSEFWVSNVITDNASLSKEELYTKNFLYKRGNQYQTEFWKDYAFMENTDEEVDFLAGNKK
ncbi:carboxypeptidase-like regulatory domain-containing protein [Pedobacter xixiisoli]|nr:carboxypeptidase-like regulatory domain-containing protein [Pedobacter xixiisoli]